MRNPVEMGPLLKSLTEVQAINDAPATAVAPEPAPDELDRVKNLAGIAAPSKPPVPGPNTTTVQGTSMQSNTPASIINKNRTLAAKIPMGSAPDPAMPQ
jgi:hypothetical protein